MPKLAQPKGWGPPVRRPSAEPKKVAMLGGSHTILSAPWDDPSWKIWAHASCRHLCQRKPDLLFDLHPKVLWSDPVKKFWDPKYLGWLRQNSIPIYMQQRDPDGPASMTYPYDRVMAEFGAHPYFANQLAWMIALALTEGVTHIGVYGCDYGTGTEYERQRGSAEFWCGVAIGRGVQVCIPASSSLLKEPRLLYGYESHPNGIRDKSYSPSAAMQAKIAAEKKDAPAKTLTVIEAGGSVPALRPVLGPDGRPSGEPIAMDRRPPDLAPVSRPACRIYTATSAAGPAPTWTAAGKGALLTWQGIRALADAEMWDGRLVAPFRSWPAKTKPADAPTGLAAFPRDGVVYTRQPWTVAEDRASEFRRLFRGVLMTSFCDPALTQAIADGTLNGTDIAHWFAVQVEAKHPRVTAMPVGVDRRDIGLLEAAPRRAWEDRDLTLYVNVTAHTAERRALVAQFAGQEWATVVQHKTSRADYFAALGRSKFVLSPPGLAWDCYRTYEALAMGAVPIVIRAQPCSDVVQGLPVLVVDDWRTVTSEWLATQGPPVGSLERITLPYWAAQIQGVAHGTHR